MGEFSLEALRRRRASGELNGTELLWREGMDKWQPLDAILQPGATSSTETKPRRSLFWIIGVLLLLVVAGASTLWVVVSQFGIPSLKSDRHVEYPSDVVALAEREVAAGTNALTEARMLVKRRDFRVRQYLGAYRERGQRNAACDAMALQLIEAWIEQNYGTNVPPPSLPELSDQLAANAACVDPLVLAVTAVNSASPAEKIRRLERALGGFENSKYRAYPKFYTTVCLATELGENPARLPTLDTLAVKRFKELLTDGSLLPEDQADIADTLVFGWGENFFKRQAAKLLPEVQQAGPSFEWLRLVLDGEHQMNKAWKARGSGWGNTVTPAGWAGFHKYLEGARASFSNAWELRPDLPLAAARMIPAAMGNSDFRDMRLWFDRATAAQVDYPPAWSSLRWGLRPRWGGSLAAIQALGATAVNTKRFDTDIPRKLFDAIKDIEMDMDLPAPQHLYGREDIWPLLQRMYTGYIAEPSQSNWRGSWRSCFAVVAFLAEHYDVAREQLEALQWQPWANCLTGWGVELSLLPLEVAARTGPWSNQVSQAEAAYRQGDPAKAFALHSELGKVANLDQQTREFLRRRLAVLDLEQQWAKGGWVELLPRQDNDPAWVMLYGQPRRLPDGSLEVESAPDGYLLYNLARLGTNFAAKVEYDVIRASHQQTQAGLIMGLPEYNGCDWHILQLKGNAAGDGSAYYGAGGAPLEVSRQVPLNPEHNVFTVKFRRGDVILSVNNRLVANNASPPVRLRILCDDFRLGLGATWNDSADTNRTVIRYRHFLVRKLPLGVDWQSFSTE